MFILRFFVFGGLCEGTGVWPPSSCKPRELKQRITTALQTVTQDMLQHGWEDLVYRFDVLFFLNFPFNF